MRSWGCPKCRNGESWVKDTARDAEGYIVRRRACAACGGLWATEELPIAPDSYWARAHSRNEARQRLYHREQRTCTKCGTVYNAGSYSKHVARSRKHEVTLAAAERDRLKARRYARQWARRKRAA